MNRWGIHFANKNFRQMDRLLGLGVDNFTILHGEAGWLPQIRQARPNTVILVRHHLTNWAERDPGHWAKKCAQRADGMHQWTIHHTLANEQNLPEEGGGTSKEWYHRIDEWNFRSIIEFKALCPWAIVHWPALASGHSEDQDDLGDGTIGYEICRRSVEASDVLDHHDYWHFPDQLFDSELSKWYAFRFAKAHAFFPDKPIFVSECGWFYQAQNPEAARHYKYFFEKLYDYPYVIGATPFIWDSGPEHGPQIWVGNDALIDTVTQAEKRETTYPQPPFGNGGADMPGTLPVWIQDLRGQATAPIGETRNLNKGIVIHHTGSDAALTNQLSYLLRAQETYHYAIDVEGKTYALYDHGQQVYHAGIQEWNQGGVAVCFIGLLMGRMPTEAAFAAFRQLHHYLCHVNSIMDVIVGHKDLKATACPGDWYPQYRGKLFSATDEEGLTQRISALEGKIAKLAQGLKSLADQIS